MPYRKIFTIRMPLILAEIYLPTHCFWTEKHLGRGLENIVYEIKDGVITGYFGEADIDAVGKAGIKKLRDIEFISRIKQESSTAVDNLINHSIILEARNPEHVDALELAQLYEKQIQLIREVYGYFNLSSPAISQAIENEIDKELVQAGFSAESIQCIKQQHLTDAPPTLLNKEERAFVQISTRFCEEKEVYDLLLNYDFEKFITTLHQKFPDLYRLLILHHAEYSFLQGYVDFHTFDLAYYINRLKDHVQIIDSKNKSTPHQKTDPNDYPPIPDSVLYFLDLSNFFSSHRMQLRIAFTRGLVALRLVLDDTARRLNISALDARYLNMQETILFLKTGAVPDLKLINERKKYVILLIEQKQKRCLVGEEALQFKQQFLHTNNAPIVTEVRGKTANPGKAIGPAKVLFNTPNITKEMQNMPNGSILITSNTRPDMIVACRKAAAIVTEEGGILSHAALVSREFGIPCIVNAKEATRIFHDGELIEVDAARGIVRKKGEIANMNGNLP